MTIEVRRATVEDIPALAGVLSRAFSTDPPMSWVFRDDSTRVERLETLFGLAVTEIFLPKGHSYTTADLAGVALWDPPGDWRTPDEVVERMAPVMGESFLAEEIDRLLTFLGMMEDVHPDDPEHWYLGILGADLDRQGQGIGSACMQPKLAEIDASGEPAYLESSNEKNVPLYERHGFRVVDVIDLPDDGPAVWRMWREGTPAAN